MQELSKSSAHYHPPMTLIIIESGRAPCFILPFPLLSSIILLLCVDPSLGYLCSASVMICVAILVTYLVLEYIVVYIVRSA